MCVSLRYQYFMLPIVTSESVACNVAMGIFRILYSFYWFFARAIFYLKFCGIDRIAAFVMKAVLKYLLCVH